MAAAAATIATSVSIPKNVRRPSIVSYTKSKWDQYFTSFSVDHQVHEEYGEAIEALKEEVKSMLIMSMANSTKTREMLVLIDTLERLGVAYHFDQQIEELLGQVFQSSHHGDEDIKFEDDDDDLFITSLRFRLLRQHRYHASCGVFDKFMGKDNKFKEYCRVDAKGLLSLYEAAHLRIHGEPILDEAVAFTKYHLKKLLESTSSPLLQDQVKRALRMPLHRSSPIIETRHFISFYEKDDSKNDLLLQLAKLDFNYVQNLYRKDLCELSRWWKELKVQSKLPHARDRVVESYLWGTMFHFEPRCSYVHIAVAKSVQLITIIDDTYDNYATVEEADLFTETMQRWNIDEVNRLPEYMKIVYKLTLSKYDVYEREAAEQGRLFAVPYAKETVNRLCEAYNNELKWIKGREMPSFEEYIANSMGTGCFPVIWSRTIPGLRFVTQETIDWLRSEPNILKASVKVTRYLNDVSGYKRESQQGINTTGLDFYMKQHGVSMQEAADKFIELTEDAWKDLNTEWILSRSDPDQVPKEMADHALGYARGGEFLYRNGKDKFTENEVAGPYIAALFVDPIII